MTTKNVADILGSSTDELNTLFFEAEKALKDLQFGVEAHVRLDPSHTGLSLVFGKHNREWRLLVEERDPEGSSRTPLTNASREQRLKAAELLPELYKQMRATADVEIGRVEAAKGQVRDFIAAMKGNKK